MPICLPPPVPQTPALHPLADACSAPLQTARLPGPSVCWPLHKEQSAIDEGGIKVLSEPAVIPIALNSIALPFSRHLHTQLPLSPSLSSTEHRLLYTGGCLLLSACAAPSVSVPIASVLRLHCNFMWSTQRL